MEKTSSSKDLSTVEPSYDIETYRHAIEEARRTLDQQLEAYNDVVRRSWRIARLNGLVATIYIAGVTSSLPSLTLTLYSGAIIGFGLILLCASAYLAVYGQQTRQVTLGQGTEAFGRIRKHDPDESVYLYETLKSYEDWIQEGHEKTRKNGNVVKKARVLLLLGVAVLSAGTLLAFVL